MSLDLLCLGVPHGIVKARQPDPGSRSDRLSIVSVKPESVEAIVGAVDCEDRGPGVGLGHSPVPLQHDDLGPDLVIYTLPLVQHLLDVVLQKNDVRTSVESPGKTICKRDLHL